MVGVPARREQVAYAARRGLSQRRSCTLVGVSRLALGYPARKGEKARKTFSRTSIRQCTASTVISNQFTCAEAQHGHSNSYPQATATIANVVASLGAGRSRNRY